MDFFEKMEGGKRRIAVFGEGETPVVYGRGREPQNMTAFREAERKCKKKNFDLSGVVDVDSAELHPRVRSRGGNVFEVVGENGEGMGFFFLRSEIAVKEQLGWISRCVSEYTRPHNLSNLHAHFVLPEEGLWGAVKSGEELKIERKPHQDDSDATKKLPAVMELSRGDQIEKLWRRYRWVSFGRQYNWAARDYFERAEEVDPELVRFCEGLCSKMGLCEGFKVEAGIVNFYQPGDSLTGHVDRSEKRMDLPLVSMSFGASCIFLLGGATREDAVLPILVRSGDVSIMRQFYHGVPRILGASEELSQADKNSDEALAMELLGSGRINLNVRQVD